MKTTLSLVVHTLTVAAFLFAMAVCGSVGYGQFGSKNSGGTVDSANFAKKTDLMIDATSPQQNTYVKGDTLKSRDVYVAPCWTLDSTALSTYGTRFERVWFKTTGDSIAVDSLLGIITGAGTEHAHLRVGWEYALNSAAGDSCTDLEITSFTTGTKAVSTKVIPPWSFVWLKVITLTGTPTEVFISLNGRRKWAQ